MKVLMDEQIKGLENTFVKVTERQKKKLKSKQLLEWGFLKA